MQIDLSEIFYGRIILFIFSPFQVSVTFTGQALETVNTHWSLKIPSLGVNLPLLVIGHTLEPIVTFSRNHLSLPMSLVGHWSDKEEVLLINGEPEDSFEFAFVEPSCYSDNISDRLTVSPMRGRLSPNERYYQK